MCLESQTNRRQPSKQRIRFHLRYLRGLLFKSPSVACIRRTTQAHRPPNATMKNTDSKANPNANGGSVQRLVRRIASVVGGLSIEFPRPGAPPSLSICDSRLPIRPYSEMKDHWAWELTKSSALTRQARRAYWGYWLAYQIERANASSVRLVRMVCGFPRLLFSYRRVAHPPNDPSSATRPTGSVDCNRSAMAGFAAAHG